MIRLALGRYHSQRPAGVGVPVVNIIDSVPCWRRWRRGLACRRRHAVSSQHAVGDLEHAPRQRREAVDAHEAAVGGAGDGLADVQARRDPGGDGRRRVARPAVSSSMRSTCSGPNRAAAGSGSAPLVYTPSLTSRPLRAGVAAALQLGMAEPRGRRRCRCRRRTVTASMRRTSSAGVTSSPKRETTRASSANSTTARSPGRSLSASTAAATAASAIFSPAMLSEVSTMSTT